MRVFLRLVAASGTRVSGLGITCIWDTVDDIGILRKDGVPLRDLSVMLTISPTYAYLPHGGGPSFVLCFSEHCNPDYRGHIGAHNLAQTSYEL